MSVDMDIRQLYFRAVYTRPPFVRQPKLPEPVLNFVPEWGKELSQQPATKPKNARLLSVTLVISVVMHGTAFYFWPEHQMRKLGYANPIEDLMPVIQVALHRHKQAPAPQLPKMLQPEPEPVSAQHTTISDRTPAVTPPPDTANSENFQTTNPNPLNLTPSTTGTASPAATNHQVFHPHLQQKINKAKTQRLSQPRARATNNHTWTNANRTTVAELGYDSCLKAQAIQTRGVARDWYMSNCDGKASTGENMLENMQRELDARNGKR